MTGDQFIFVLWCFTGFLATPILFCWILFGIARFKGWNDPEITPLEIIDRLTQKECNHKLDLYDSKQGAMYAKCIKCGKMFE